MCGMPCSYTMPIALLRYAAIGGFVGGAIHGAVCGARSYHEADQQIPDNRTDLTLYVAHDAFLHGTAAALMAPLLPIMIPAAIYYQYTSPYPLQSLCPTMARAWTSVKRLLPPPPPSQLK